MKKSVLAYMIFAFCGIAYVSHGMFYFTSADLSAISNLNATTEATIEVKRAFIDEICRAYASNDLWQAGIGLIWRNVLLIGLGIN